MMSPLCKILHRPAKERRQLSSEDIRTLADVDLDSEGWSPSKAMRVLEIMQIALRTTRQPNLFEGEPNDQNTT